MTEVWNAEDNARIPIKANNETLGFATPADTLGAVVQRYAQQVGFKSFSVVINGSKVDSSTASKTMAELQATEIELVAKEARG